MKRKHGIWAFLAVSVCAVLTRYSSQKPSGEPGVIGQTPVEVAEFEDEPLLDLTPPDVSLDPIEPPYLSLAPVPPYPDYKKGWPFSED